MVRPIGESFRKPSEKRDTRLWGVEGTQAEVLDAAGIDTEFLRAVPDELRNEAVLQRVPELQLFSAPQQ